MTRRLPAITVATEGVDPGGAEAIERLAAFTRELAERLDAEVGPSLERDWRPGAGPRPGADRALREPQAPVHAPPVHVLGRVAGQAVVAVHVPAQRQQRDRGQPGDPGQRGVGVAPDPEPPRRRQAGRLGTQVVQRQILRAVAHRPRWALGFGHHRIAAAERVQAQDERGPGSRRRPCSRIHAATAGAASAAPAPSPPSPPRRQRHRRAPAWSRARVGEGPPPQQAGLGRVVVGHQHDRALGGLARRHGGQYVGPLPRGQHAPQRLRPARDIQLQASIGTTCASAQPGEYRMPARAPPPRPPRSAGGRPRLPRHVRLRRRMRGPSRGQRLHIGAAAAGSVTSSPDHR